MLISVAEMILVLVVIGVGLFNPAAGWIGNGYNLASVKSFADGFGIEAILTPVRPGNYYGNDISFLVVTARYETENRLHVHITDANTSRWEIPQSLLPRPARSSTLPLLSDKYLNFTYTSEPFGFAVTRVSTNEILFNCTPNSDNVFGPLVFKDQYLEISTKLPQDSALFGLGESTRPDGLRLTPGRTYTLWNRDIGANVPNINLYGSFPYYIDVREGGSAHAVLLLNSNAMDVYYGGEFVTFKPVGGVLDFCFFSGPTPAEVLNQYTELVGRPAAMPYWTLGFHQCRWGYKDVEDLEGVVGNYSAARIPLETIWSDIDYMDAYAVFTLDPVNYPPQKLQAFVGRLHANGQHYVPIVDPGIPLHQNYSTLTRGLAADIFIKDANGKPFLGQVWPGAVYFPDFLHPQIEDYWTNEVRELHKIAAFDGLWIDMNEASNFCDGTSCSVAERPNNTDLTICYLSCSSAADSYWDNPPYLIQNANGPVPLRTRSIAVSAVHAGGEVEYNTHNLYGLSEAIATKKALISTLNKRPFILSRSSFVGSGAYAAHWTGDNGATWDDLGHSIVGVLNSGLFGVPMVGADICGFQFNTTEELCARWIELGAFYPFSRNHAESKTIRQELYIWESVTNISRTVLGMRYRLLPFLYTLVYEAHINGAPMARPLFYEYFQDSATWGVSSQFLLGKGLLISPVLSEGASTVTAYFPKGTWYNLFNFSQVFNLTAGSNLTLDAPLNTINVHVAAGSIIPMQDAALTTAAVRKSSFTLLVAFSSSDDESQATGELFLDDGEEIDMKLEAGSATFVEFHAMKSGGQGSVASRVTYGEYAQQQGWRLETIVVLGLESAPSTLNIDGRPASSSVTVMYGSSVHISKLNLPMGQDFALSWWTDMTAFFL